MKINRQALLTLAAGIRRFDRFSKTAPLSAVCTLLPTRVSESIENLNRYSMDGVFRKPRILGLTLCLAIGFSYSATSLAIDTDSDTIDDEIDLDDDNDGILNVVEGMPDGTISGSAETPYSGVLEIFSFPAGLTLNGSTTSSSITLPTGTVNALITHTGVSVESINTGSARPSAQFLGIENNPGNEGFRGVSSGGSYQLTYDFDQAIDIFVFDAEASANGENYSSTTNGEPFELVDAINLPFANITGLDTQTVSVSATNSAVADSPVAILVSRGVTQIVVNVTQTSGGKTGLGVGAFSVVGLDTDMDGIANHRDLDSDNDGISDLYESGNVAAIALDTDEDGTISSAQGEDVDSDLDGLMDVFEDGDLGADVGTNPVDAGGTANLPDYLDLDSDGDGIPDTIEARPTANYALNDGDVTNDDADGDGVIALFDENDGAAALFGGKHDNFNNPVNTDGTDTPDYRDTNSDNDSETDLAEGEITLVGGFAATTAPSYTDPDGSINDPLSSADGSDLLENDDADTAEVDYRSAPPGAPTVLINDGGDELLSADEIAASVTATITIPADSVPGDTLKVDTNGDGTSDHTITLTATEIASGSVDVVVDPSHVPANAVLTVSAEVTDASGVTGPSASDTSTTDSMAPGPSTIVITDGGDDYLSASEIAAGVTATVTTPINSVAGDTLTVDTDGDGVADHTIVLTAAQAGGNTVGITIDPTHVPADGVVTASAQITDVSGNAGATGSDSSTTDSMFPGAAVIAINDGGDDSLSAAEIAAGVTATVTTPADSVAGDTLTVDTDGDGVADHTIILTAAQAGGNTVDIIVDPSHVPADGVITASAGITDASGNIGASMDDISSTDSMAPGAPTIVINDGGDELLSSDEIAAGVTATITTPTDSVAGDTLTVDTDGDGIADHSIVLVAAQAGGNTVDITVDPSHVPADGVITASAGITDASGNIGTSMDDVSTTDSMAPGAPTIVINDGGDELLSAAEIAAGVTATVTTPADSVAGDTLTVDTDGDGVADHTIVLTAAQAGGNTVDITVDPVHIPDDGVLSASAEITDSAGNVGASMSDMSTTDSILPVLSAENVGPVADTTPILMGATDQSDGSTVTVTGPDGNEVCIATVASGEWTCDSTVEMPYGANNLIASISDLAGNQVQQSFTADIEIDTDSDGLVNSQDIDDDNDGIPDLVEQANDSALDTDGDGIIDSLDLDSDNDGIPDVVEAGGADVDGDGTIDGYTDSNLDGIDDATMAAPLRVGDFDMDGLADYLDVDSDNDGLPDILEAGGVDADADGVIDSFIDADGDGMNDTTASSPLPIDDNDGDGNSDHLDLDSDNDGITDVTEAGGIDVNGDGMVDNFVDADNDGLDDGIAINPLPIDDTDGDGSADYLDLDSDNDGLTDTLEAGGSDTDGDGVVDNFSDANHDGLDDSVAVMPLPITDTDGNDFPDYLDLDSDSDGIPDSVEAGSNPAIPVDTDGDGTADFLELDSDNDGMPDSIEAGSDPAIPVDTDGNGVPDFLEPPVTDSDGDGIPDADEGSADTDRDGVLDYLDIDSDNDGLLDADEAGNFDEPVDTDGDGIADYLDLDSDNDGLTDAQEAGGDDANGDGIVDNFIDNDGNGHDDGVGVAPLADPDFDGDGIVDHLDSDSDNDGLPDLLESSGLSLSADADGDGRIDNFFDSNSDGLADGISANVTLDTDADNAPNHLDLDSDNDGIFDLIEAGGNDTDDDGRVDAWSDSDNDGIADSVDVDVTGGEDLDNDGIDDFADVDFVNGTDSDGDGIIDAFDDDALGSGFLPFNPDQPAIAAALTDFNGNNVPDALEAGTIHAGLAGSGCSVSSGKSASVDPLLLLMMIGSAGVFFTRGTRRTRQVGGTRANTGVVAISLALFLSACTSLPTANADELSDEPAQKLRYYNDSNFDDRIQDHFYVAAGLGASWLEPDTSEVRNIDVNDRVNLGGQLTLGMDLSRQVAVEIHTADLGSAGLSPRGRIAYNMHGASALLYAGKRRHRFRRHGFTGYGRIGFGMMVNSAVGDVQFQTDNATHLLFGVGLEYMTKRGLGLRAEAISYEEDVRYGQLALIYRTGKRNQRKVVQVVEAVDTFTPVSALPVPAEQVTEPIVEYDVCSELNGVLVGVNFHSDSVEPTDASIAVVNSAAEKLLECESVQLLISAHTDSVGPESYNLALSKRRARAVAQLLNLRGVNLNRMTANAFGESQPIDTNATTEGRSRNRRVEVIAQ